MKGKSHPFSTLIACFAILGIIAGGAVAFPAKFDAVVSKARQLLHHDASPSHERAAQSGGGSNSRGGEAHTPEDCQGAIDGVLQSPPSGEDAHGLEHAIAVIQANCGKDPKAAGLLNALTHLAANAQKHDDHVPGNGHAGGQGHAFGHGETHGNGKVNGHANGHGPP